MVDRLPKQLLSTLATVLLVSASANQLHAQPSISSPGELDQLLAPIALYPDGLLAEMISASTNPQETLDANDWLHRNPGMSGSALTNSAEAQGFDPVFIALMAFPEVLDTMARNIDDYAAIGAAFEADEAAVMDSVQRLRVDAYNSGALVSGPQHRVQLEPYLDGDLVVIQPTDPQAVYVPRYDPGVVFGGETAQGNWIQFGKDPPPGWGRWGWNWRDRHLLYNRTPWRPGSWRYRSPRPSYRRRPPSFSGRPPVRPPRNPGRAGRPAIRPPRRSSRS